MRGERLQALYEEAKREAKAEMDIFKFHPLFIAGLNLYWGEGDKTLKGSVRIGTTDPKMLKVFKLFLEEICGVISQDIRAWVLVYPDLDETVCKNYWSQQTGIDKKTLSGALRSGEDTKQDEFNMGYAACMSQAVI